MGFDIPPTEGVCQEFVLCVTICRSRSGDLAAILNFSNLLLNFNINWHLICWIQYQIPQKASKKDDIGKITIFYHIIMTSSPNI